jgi:uncharacterized protein YlxP (DUF503 family)
MFVGVLRLTFHLHGNGSLKGKRRIMRTVIERTRSKFNASVAEVADNDVHQKAVVGVSVVGNSASHVDAMLSNVTAFVEQMGAAPLSNVETEVIPLGDIGGDYAPWNGPQLDEEGKW